MNAKFISFLRKFTHKTKTAKYAMRVAILAPNIPNFGIKSRLKKMFTINPIV